MNNQNAFFTVTESLVLNTYFKQFILILVNYILSQDPNNEILLSFSDPKFDFQTQTLIYTKFQTFSTIWTAKLKFQIFSCIQVTLSPGHEGMEMMQKNRVIGQQHIS